MAASAPRIGALLGEWQLEPALLALSAAAALAYARGVARVRRWPRGRTAAFAIGLGALLVAQQSGIDGAATRLLSVHMLQHLLVTMVAAPAIVAAAPATLALRALHGPSRAVLARACRGRVATTLTRPIAAWSAFAVVLVGSHVPAVYDLALRDPPLHAIEHAVYLWTAVLFWTPLLATEPLPRRLGGVGATVYLLVAMVPMTLVGVWLLSAGEVLYPHYEIAAPAAGVAALADQRAGATEMWLGGTVTLVVALVACSWSAFAREERRARAREAHADRRSTLGAAGGPP